MLVNYYRQGDAIDLPPGLDGQNATLVPKLGSIIQRRLVSQAEIIHDLAVLGIERGSTLIVHSSLKSIGYVDGGAPCVVEALLKTLGPDGHLLMPTFVHPTTDRIFSMKDAPSRTGAITEALRHWPGAVRSRHPTHSVTIVGPRASEFAEGHPAASALGKGSPLHRAALAGANVLMIGCDMKSCSLIHVAESIAGVSYLGVAVYPGYSGPIAVVDPDGHTEILPLRHSPGDSTGFMIAQNELDRRGLITHGDIGQSPCLKARGTDILQVAGELLARDPLALLCDDPACAVCVEARSVPQGV